MLLTADSLSKYIQSHHNIYCLSLILFYHFDNSDKQIQFWHSQLFCVFHPLPLHPHLFLHNINTDCPKHNGSWWWGVWKRKYVIIWTHTAIRCNVSHGCILMIHMHKLKRCDKCVQKECVTEYNVQHTCTHTHTHTHTTTKHINTKHSPPLHPLLSPQTACNHPQF
jgi:hypothetical protein